VARFHFQNHDMALARELEALDRRLETRTEKLGIERVFETVAHERRVIVFDVHVEVADMGEEKIQDRVVVAKLPPRQYDFGEAIA
jgi:hypothetical protein